MRILHVDTGRELRGGQRQLLLLLKGLKERGHEQVLLAREPTLRHWKGLPVNALNLLRSARSADIVHAHDARAHTLAALLCPGKPLVAARRVAFPIGRSPLSGWKYSRAGRYIAVSEFVRRSLAERGIPEAKIAVVHDGVAMTEQAPAAKGPDLASGDSLRVVAPAVDDPLKGADLLAAACASLGAELRFSTDFETDFSRADVFAYLSESEGLGSAILAAMAHRIPVVASRTGGIPEIVEHEVTGLLVENEAAAVADAIRRLSEDRTLARRCIENAYRRVSEDFSDTMMVRRTEQVYRAVLGLDVPPC